MIVQDAAPWVVRGGKRVRKLASRVKERRLLSAMIAIAFCLSATLGMLVTSSSNGIDTSVREVPTGEPPTVVRMLTLTVHDPIFIDGNSGFTGPNASTGITRGSGTESDPYIIEGWEIDATGYEYSIFISNSNVFFIIASCNLHNGGVAGVDWEGVSNGTLTNSTVSSSYFGVAASGSNNIISNIDISGCTLGIVFHESNNILSHNNLRSNGVGIYSPDAFDSTLADNNCSNNTDYGIWLRWSSGNILFNNTCIDNPYGIGLYEGSLNRVFDNFCSGNRGNGISLDGSSHNDISENRCLDNGAQGIYVGRLESYDDSTANNLSGNICLNNEESGIRLSSAYNCLSNNTCSSNNHGIYLTGASYSTLVYNTCSYNSDGICSYWSYMNTLSNNTCGSNTACGIWLYGYSSGNTLSRNTCSNNYDGMNIGESSGNTLSKNTCNSNYEYGMYLNGWSNTLVNNTCSLNGRYGAALEYSDGNRLTNNTFMWNVQYGLHADVESNDNGIWNNTFYYNNGAGDTYDPAHVQAYDDGTSNWWNSSDGYGNYWSDWTTPDVAPPDGIVDVPYDIAGSAGAKDYYPLTTEPPTPIPEFGMMPFVVMALLMAIVLTIGARRRKAQ